MTGLTPGNPEADRHDRFRSLRPSFHNLNVGHILSSLRVALAFIGIAIISVAVAILFLPLVRRWPQENIGG
jgi:hypothetical protein